MHHCLTAYARRHRDWLARLECESGESTELAPLIAIEAGESELVLVLGSERHHLPRPRRVVEQTDDDGDRGLRIELSDRTIFLYFRISADPETLG